jgi:hypothetical protein
VFIDPGNNIIFLKPKKCAGTSAEIYLRQFLSARAVGTREDFEAEEIARSLGLGPLRNVNLPIRAIDKRTAKQFYRSRFKKWPQLGYHQSALSVRAMLGKNFSNFQKVSIARNPFDWTVSLFFWRHRSMPWDSGIAETGRVFAEWVHNRLHHERIKLESVYMIHGQAVVDFWVSFENLSSGLESLAKQIFPHYDSEAAVSVERITAKAQVRPTWASTPALFDLSPAVADVVREELAFHFETFGYSQNPGD